MKKIIFILLLFVSCKNTTNDKIELGYQNDTKIQKIGIGLIQQVKTSEPIELYKDKLFTKILKDDITTIPILNKPDYGILFFVCLKKNTSYYKIAISKNKYAYIKTSKKYIFYSWKNFLIEQVTSFDNKDEINNKPKIKINGHTIKKLVKKEDDEIEIIEVNGSWIKVNNTTQNIIYWLKWKEKNKLLITINLLM